MTQYYLRIEGVNFSSFVFDTVRIKVVRGGSLMLLNSVDWLGEKAKENGLPPLEKITAGASWGLFSYEAENDYQAGEVVARVRHVFDQDERYRHATITVESLAAGKDYPATRDRLEALSRWSQMRSPSMAIPSAVPPSSSPVTGVCELDGVRPATGTINLKREDPDEQRKAVSASVRARWHENAGEKREFYRERTGFDLKFTEDLEELAHGEDHGNLHGKMAVIYLDGNDFGKRARRYCTDTARQKAFDQMLREEYQNGALKNLLRKMQGDDGCKSQDKIRLETLLWGGDEIIWVVPAWRGWWMLCEFFQETRNWKIKEREIEERLTHGAGLVFCHHDAPIQPILRLARRLGDLAKGDRSRNRLAYQVLESFDHAGSDLEAMRERRWPLARGEGLILEGDAMSAAAEAMAEIKGMGLPKRQLYRIAQKAFTDRRGAEALADRLRKAIDGLDSRIDALGPCFGAGLATWLHLLELWNFVGVER